MNELCALQSQVFTTGEFNYQFADDQVRDDALASVVQMLRQLGAETVTATPDGDRARGYLRRAWGQTRGSERCLVTRLVQWFTCALPTNEKAVVRSYFSAGDTARGSSPRGPDSQAPRGAFQRAGRGLVIDTGRTWTYPRGRTTALFMPNVPRCSRSLAERPAVLKVPCRTSLGVVATYRQKKL